MLQQTRVYLYIGKLRLDAGYIICQVTSNSGRVVLSDPGLTPHYIRPHTYVRQD